MEYPVIAKILLAATGSEELDEFYGLAGNYDDWFEEQLEHYKEETPSWYPDEWDSFTKEEKEEKIYEAIRDAEESEPSSTIFFRNPKYIYSPWLVRFTDKDPIEFARKLLAGEIVGYGPENLGLTLHYGSGSGDLSFAFELSEADPKGHGDYGKNAVLLHTMEAVSADHISDYERQTVFDLDLVDVVIPCKSVNDTYEVYNDEGKHLFTVPKTKGVYEKILDKFYKKSPNVEASTEKPENLEETFAWFEAHKEDYVGGWLPLNDELKNYLRDSFKNLKEIYRAIRVSNIDGIKFDDMGIFWTYNEEKPKAYWGEGDIWVVFGAKYDPATVDWIGTVQANIRMETAGEDEIRLLPGSKIKINQITATNVKTGGSFAIPNFPRVATAEKTESWDNDTASQYPPPFNVISEKYPALSKFLKIPELPLKYARYIRGLDSMPSIDSTIKKYRDAILPEVKKLIPGGMWVYRGMSVETSFSEGEELFSPDDLVSFSESKSTAEAYARFKARDGDSGLAIVIKIWIYPENIYFHYALSPVGSEHPKDKEIIINPYGMEYEVTKKYKEKVAASSEYLYLTLSKILASSISPLEVYKADLETSPGGEVYSLDWFKKHSWELCEIPLDQVIRGGVPIWTPDQKLWDEEDPESFLDEKEAQEYAKLTTPIPPILVERKSGKFRILNGRHRSRAAFLRGEKTIPAYVGIKKAGV